MGRTWPGIFSQRRQAPAAGADAAKGLRLRGLLTEGLGSREHRNMKISEYIPLFPSKFRVRGLGFRVCGLEA